jgi:hypothetical protein
MGRDVSQMVKTRTCPKCNGTGTIFHHYTVSQIECFLCEGKGYVTPDDLALKPDKDNPITMQAHLKEIFVQRVAQVPHPRVLVTVVKLPNDALEVITNREKLQDKIDYYLTAYDKHFRLKANPQVQIVGFILL